jgi:diguanylate cyclase (GGDEF)-like protein/PAS domain S-box-containing protein
MSDLTAQLDASERDRGQTAPEEPAPVADESEAAKTAWGFQPVRLIIICGIILIGAVIAATAGLLLNLRNHVLAESERNLTRLSLVIAEEIDRTFQSVELIQTAVIERMQGFRIASAWEYKQRMSFYDIHQDLKQRISALPHINAIVLTDTEGKLINFSRSWPAPNVEIPENDPSENFKSDPHLSFLVGKPVRSPVTGSWVIPVSRKFTGPDGEFLGVVTGVIDAQQLEQNFKAITAGSNEAIALFRRDGTMLARHPHLERVIGRSFSSAGVFANLLPKSDSGTIREIGPVDGEDRLISAHSLSHYPIVVVVTTTVADALANWKRGAIVIVGVALMIGLVIGGAVAFSAWLVGKKLREQNLRWKAALNNMSQGLCMFDARQRLIVCNKRYADLYGLNDGQTKRGTTLRAILEHRIASGNAPEDRENYIRDRLNEVSINKPYQTINRLRDGCYVSVVHRPMANGGWVATHEDVTEAKRREESFLLLFKSNPVAMWVYDRESLRFLAVNEAAVAHYGYSREQFLAMTVRDIRPSEERERFDQAVRINGGVYNGEETWRHQKLDGTIIYVAIYSQALSYEGHKASLVAAIDLTERKRAEDELHRTKNFFNTVIENVPLPIVVKSAPSAVGDARDCRITLINRACEELFGVPRQQLIGKTADELYPKEHADFVVAFDNETLQSDQAVLIRDHSFVTPSNGIRVLTSKKVAIRNDDGIPQHLLTVLEDVTERRRAEKRIVHMAHYDMLTGLPNRATFNDTMNATLDRAATTGAWFSILSIDLDHFKEANDTYGHLIGDALLLEVARRLQAAAGGAFLARLGGDEFALIVADGAQPTAAAALAERLLAAVVADFAVEDHHLKLGMSIGVATYPTDGADAKILMTNADAALYRAKAEMRGSVLFFEPEMGARLRERRALKEDLRTAIDRGELLLHYQPQKKMSGETIGFEALVRWQCPKRGMVSPDTFIPIAEESGLIITLDEWVLREACREAASWPQPLSIAVNISPIQFRHGDLPRLIHSILLETGLTPARLELEITESVFIDDFSRAISILNRLKSLGARIAMDDFGTGYSSLCYLHSFPFDKIKIDQSFIGDLEHNHHSRAIVRAVIGLGRSLDLLILAEGVETEAQHAFLVHEGCDKVQGYLTGRPLPIADYDELVGRQTRAQQNYAVTG